MAWLSMRHPNIFSRLLLVSVFFLLSGMAGIASAEDGKPAEKTYPAFKYSETATEPVIEYNLVHDMLAEPDPEPLLRVYGNGRVHVHYPVYMKKAGDYELQLSKPELNALIRELANDGIIGFDKSSIRQQRKQLEQQQHEQTGTLFSISDSSHTVIIIRLDEYQKAPGVAKSRNINKRFSWPDLKQDAGRFPQSREITNANNSAQRLKTLMQRSDLVKIR